MDNRSGAPPPPPPFSGSISPSIGFSSPYLNLDPKLLLPNQSASDYIYLDGSNRPSRGRFELAFSQIGGSVMAGAAVGGIIGGYNGIKLTSNLGTLQQSGATAVGQQLSWAVRRSQILNYIVKTGALTANTFGVVSLLYSAIGVGLGFVNENHDDYNTLAAGTLTGILFRGLSNPQAKADAGNKLITKPLWQVRLRRSLTGGLIGLALSAFFVVATNKDKYLRK